MRLRGAVAFLIVLLGTAAFLSAQETTGTLSGRVVDSQGLAVPGAAVTVSGPQGNRTITTEGDGRFSVPFLVPGTYDVHAALQGFKAADLKGAIVRLGQTVDLQLTMQVGAVTETVDVTGAPSLIDTRSTTTGAVIDSELMERVPIGHTGSREPIIF